MFVCKDCIDKFEPVVALATFYERCAICGEYKNCLDLSPKVKRIDTETEILELIIDHKDGKFITWSMLDPNDPTRKFGEDDVTLIRQVIDGPIKVEVNRADGPKSPCCGVAMVWINAKQRYICPNCGNYPPEKSMQKQPGLDEMWKWIDRHLDDGFFETAGKITDKEEQQKRMDEIPDLLKPLAHTIITLACVNKETMGSGGPCLFFRCELFSVYKELLEKGIDIYLPYAWFCDGVMIEPEWIVRITNGIIGWSCKPEYDNPDTCGLENCRYRRFDPSITTSPTVPCPHLKDCLSQDDNGLTFNCEELIDMGVCRIEKKKENASDLSDQQRYPVIEPSPLIGEPEEEPEIHPDILKAARGGGAAHYSTEDGQQYLVTFIGLKETAYDGPDPSPEEPEKCPKCGGPLYLTHGGGFENIGVDVCRDCGYHPAIHTAEEPEKGEKQLHAGLEDGGLNLIVFDDTEQLRKMLNTIGFSVDDEGIVINKGEQVTCSGCGCKLTLDDIGHVMPPDHFYCSSSVCIMDYYERYGHLEENRVNDGSVPMGDEEGE